MRSRPQGRAHRAWIRTNIIAHLRHGCMLPTGKELGVHLGICQSEADRHLRQVLSEEGIRTIVCAVDKGRRKFVMLPPISTLSTGNRCSVHVDRCVDNLSSHSIQVGQ